MSASIIHAKSSAKRWGGTPEDYLPIHELMDSSKGAFSSNAHRAATHHSFFTQTIIPRIFGHEALNSDGKSYVPKEVAEQHVLEDFQQKFLPTLQDWLENIEFKSWMNNGQSGDVPSSFKKINESRTKKVLQPAPVETEEAKVTTELPKIFIDGSNIFRNLKD